MAANSNHSRNSEKSPASDVCLLLRSHAESRWLSNELVPVLREIERGDSISERQLGAAHAYLEVLWIEACGRARETESARVELDALGADSEQTLHEKALRYHAAVRRLRGLIERRVTRLLAAPSDVCASSASAERPISERPARP
jgi:hypothetical protein